MHPSDSRCGQKNSFVKNIRFTDGISITPGRVYLCAGKNNEKIWRYSMGMPKPKIQQTRPVYVGTVRSSELFPLYAHIIVDNTWQMTVTSSTDAIGRVAWRLGGPLFENKNPKALADLIIMIMRKDYNSLKSMGLEGRKNILSRFDVDKMCQTTFTEYKKLIKLF